MSSEALIVDAVRSPIGRRNGSLAATRGDELAAQVLNGLVARHDLDPAEVEDVQMGCVTQIGEQGWNIGRMAPMVAGWPETVCGTTVDRQCGSSMQTNFNAATAVWAGQLDVVVSAGVEMMSRVPMGSNGGDLSDKLLERWQIVPQGISAEALASEWKLSREALDAFSLESHRRAIAAIDDGRFENEIVPVEVGAAGAAVLFAVDEAPRRDTSAEKLASLQPAFLPDGVVTAGNSSQIVDGAAAVLVTSEAAAARLGLEPRARFVSFGLAGVDPYRMLHGNPEACRKALAKAGLGWDDISVIEVNEAFASVVLQFAHDAGLEDRFDDINPNGGGISLGHPLGATGARVTATLLNELERREARYGVACMCIGFGQAIAAVVERDLASYAATTANEASTSAQTSAANSTNARAAGERCRSRCHASAIRRAGISGSISSTLTRGSFGSTASSGTSAAPKPDATSPCTVPLSSERNAISKLTPRCPSSPSARAVLLHTRLPISVRSPSSAMLVRASPASSWSAGSRSTYGSRRICCDSNGPSSVGNIAKLSSSSPRSISRSRSSSEVDSVKSSST